MLQQRSSGLLLHITSLPSPHGLGDLGSEAYRFVDFLSAAGQTYWQILPVTPVDPGAGFSPYSSPSAFAGNVLLISLEKLAEDGLLSKEEVDIASLPISNRTNLWVAYERKMPLLRRAADTFRRIANNTQLIDYELFCQEEAHWLNDYVLFTALQQDTGEYWWVRWAPELVRREPEALARELDRLREPIEELKVLQFLFFQQWRALTDYCFAKRIHIIGDIPIYVQHNSPDVWAFQDLFKLDENGMPTYVAGAPPDMFSEEGQRWGNPVYDWPKHEASGFQWWIRRLRHQMKLYSLTRLDHFLGFAVYWEIPATETSARVGEWIKAPIDAFMEAMYRQFVHLPVIAEDLGERAPDVQPHLRHFQIPGMRVLQFGYGEDVATSMHAPHNHTINSVAYTGTHDNPTTAGWWMMASTRVRKNVEDYLGVDVTTDNVTAHLSRLTMLSVARLAVLPLQDALNLDESHRMNTPGGAEGNWSWRFTPDQITDEVAERLLALTQMSGRI
jgi:4-alpha-glucanotransferase